MPGYSIRHFFISCNCISFVYFTGCQMRTEKRESLLIFLNSTAYCLLSYLFVYMLFQLTTSVASIIFDIPNTLFYNRIEFNVRPEVWTFDSVKVVFSSGNVMLLLIALTSVVVIIKAIELNGMLRLFFIWSFIHSISMLFGSFIMGAFNFEGFGIVLSYLYLVDTVKMLLLFAGFLLLIGIGMAMVKALLFTANIYYNFLSPEMRPAFRRDQFILPYAVSTFLLLIIKFPTSSYETIILIIPIFILIPLFWGIGRFPVFYFEETKKSIQLNYKLVIFTLCVYTSYRILLGIGLNIN